MPTRQSGAAVYVGLVALLLLGGCRNAASNGMPAGGGHIDSSSADGVIYGRLLAGSGAPSRETAEPIGVSGQQVSVIDPSTGNTVATATTGPDGSFRLSVASGAYLIQGGGNRQYVRVGAGEKAKVNLMLPTP